jgi:hypothetical protein
MKKIRSKKSRNTVPLYQGVVRSAWEFHLVCASYLFVRFSFRIYCTFRKQHTKKSLENIIDPILPRQIERPSIWICVAAKEQSRRHEIQYFSYFLLGSVLLYLPRKVMFQTI